jgi:hypothetical protein
MGTEQFRVFCVWRFKDQRGKDYTRDVTLVFDPSNNWALTESNVQNPEGSEHRKVSYRTESVGGFRPPERVVDVLTGPGGWRKEEVVFSKYERSRFPEDAFTLSAFGLPEPAGSGQSDARPWYLWLSFAGGLCVVFAGFLYWLKKRATNMS